MKGLTICQPYAEMIAALEKPIENRTWPTSYRGPLLIHAGRSRAWLDEGDEHRYPNMAYGAVVAIADFVACLQFGPAPWPERFSHLRAHQHANGPWCFVLENVRRLATPIQCTWHQGLWIPEPHVIAAVNVQLGEAA